MRKLFIGPKQVVQALVERNKAPYIISITDPTEPPLDVPEYVKICRIRFSDLDKSHLEVVKKAANRVRLCTIRDVERALIFATTVPKCDLLAVHCGAGLSRAPAIALGVLLNDEKEHTGEIGIDQLDSLVATFFQKYPCVTPNKLVVEWVEEYLYRPGIWDRVYRHSSTWVPDGSEIDFTDTSNLF
jgi:predicted protein tyrosine phosphatase